VASPPAAKEGIIDLSRNLVHREQRDRNVRSLLATFGDAGQAALLLDEEQDPAGVLEHRTVAAEWMRRPGFAPAAEDMVICSGVQTRDAHGFGDYRQARRRRGYEAVTYGRIRAIAALSGLQLRGLRWTPRESSRRRSRTRGRRGARILYVTPTLHNPTAITTSAGRRQEIARIAETHGVQFWKTTSTGSWIPAPRHR